MAVPPSPGSAPAEIISLRGGSGLAHFAEVRLAKLVTRIVRHVPSRITRLPVVLLSLRLIIF
jgi:hypothetical protein